MKENYKIKVKTVKIITSSAVLALFSANFTAQTVSDRETLRKSTKVEVLSAIKANLQKKTPSVTELKAIAKSKGLQFRTEEPSGQIQQFIGFNDYGEPIYLSTDNAKAAITTGVNLIQKGGVSGYNLSGKDVKIIEWDGGRVRSTHQELAGKISFGTEVSPITTYSDHSTHVAGTVLGEGIDARAKGMAPEASIIGYDFNNAETEMATSFAKQEGLISTHSYGQNTGWTLSGTSWVWSGSKAVHPTIDYKFGFYSSRDALIDDMLLNAPWHTLVRSAGNHRGDGPATAGSGSTPEEIDGASTGGYDTVGSGSVNKNGIIVGAVQPVLSYTGPESVKMTSFSSWGPSDDGRIIPTIVTDGYNVYSSYATADNAYGAMSGTSMATPGATGAIALIQEFSKTKTGNYFTSPLVKSIVTNTAKEAGNPGPDYVYGFGLLDAKAAVDLINNSGKSSKYEEGLLQNGSTLTYTYDVLDGVPFKTTLAWLDRKGVPKTATTLDSSFLNDRSIKLIDDLDIRVELNGQVYMPYVLSPDKPSQNATTGDNIIDNIEQVYIANPTAGKATITITHKKTINPSGVPFGLSVTGVVPSGLDLALTDIAPQVPLLEYSETTPIKVSVKNQSKTDGSAYSVKLTLKDESDNIVSEETKSGTAITAGTDADYIFNIDLSKALHTYTLIAEVQNGDDVVTSNNTKTIDITPIYADLSRPGSSMLENFNNPLDARGWTIVDANGDKKTWGVNSSPEYIFDGSTVMLNTPQGTGRADDWLISNPVKLKQGDTYKVSYYTRKNSTSKRNENLEIRLGDAATVGAMGDPIHTFTWNQSLPNNWVKNEFTFVAPKDGLQYIGIHHYSNVDTTSWNIGLEDFFIANTNVGKPDPQIGIKIKNGAGGILTYSDVQLYDYNEGDDNGSSTYKWTISPADYTFVNGTSATSKSPEVRFSNVTDPYTIKLEVTNPLGAGHVLMTDLVRATPITTTAGFKIDRAQAFSKENIQFENTSAGYPVATGFQWSITPSGEGFYEFLEGTTPNSEHINVKFNKAGKYDVSYTALVNPNVTFAPIKSTVTILADDGAPKKLSGEILNGTINLAWEKPASPTLIFEDFQAATFPPAGWQVLNANNDSNTWKRVSWSGSVAPINYFVYLTNTNFATDDYLITPKFESTLSDYSELTFTTEGVVSIKNNLKVYMVKTNSTDPLTAAQIKAGILLYNGPIVDAVKNKSFKIDLKQYLDGTPYRIAFYGNTASTTSNNYITIDDVKISRPITVPAANLESVLVMDQFKLSKEVVNEAIKVDDYSIEATAKPAWQVINLGLTSNVTDYEIIRDGATIGKIASPNTIFIDNSIQSNSTYTYTVKALYDGINPSKESDPLTISTSTLSVAEGKINEQIQLFPNPVVDNFKVKFAQKLVGKASVELYSADGKKVWTGSLSEDQLSSEGVNVNGLSTGTYIVVVKNGSQSFSTKIIKK